MNQTFVSSSIRTTRGNRVLIGSVGVITQSASKVIIVARGGGVLAAPVFDDLEDANIELTALVEQIDAWEAATLQGGAPSNYLRLSNGPIVLMTEIGTVNPTGKQLFINDRSGDMLVLAKFDDEEAALSEAGSVNAQMDAWEQHEEARKNRRKSRFHD